LISGRRNEKKSGTRRLNSILIYVQWCPCGKGCQSSPNGALRKGLK